MYTYKLHTHKHVGPFDKGEVQSCLPFCNLRTGADSSAVSDEVGLVQVRQI